MNREPASTASSVAANQARAALWELAELRASLVDEGIELPVVDGMRRYVDLDHAATTPALAVVKRAVERVLPFYGGVHRGAGFKSEMSSELYQRCRSEVAEFVGADRDRDVVVFGRSTTELVNVAAQSASFEDDDLVMVTGLEHHSNDLPWRRAARVVRVEPDAQGFLSEDAVEAGFRRYRGRVKLLAVTAASNVTGSMPDTGALADLAHRYGAKIFVDAAQLVGHRRVRMGAGDRKLDFIVFSGHKMYAPFGAGALVGPREVFERKAPLLLGGGAITLVTAEEALWADAPSRQEAGTPNLIGAVALAQACRALKGPLLDALAERERALTRLALGGLRRIPKVTLYGSSDLELARDRVGIVPFNVSGVAHQVVAEALSVRFGIGVRSGCFCAQPLVTRLLGYPELSFTASEQARSRDPLALPGMVRVSFGLSNSEQDVEALCEALAEIASGSGRSRVSEADRLQRLSDLEAFSRDLFTP